MDQFLIGVQFNEHQRFLFAYQFEMLSLKKGQTYWSLYVGMFLHQGKKYLGNWHEPF